MFRSSGSRTFPAITTLFVFLMVFGVAAEAETGRCVSAKTESDVRLPDGSLHPAGRIEICMTQRYSPVSGLHTTRLADGFAGMFLSHRTQSEGMTEDGQPYIQFLRTSGGALILDAYAVPDGQKRMWLYRIHSIGTKKAKRLDPELRLALEAGERDDVKQVVRLTAALY